MNKAKPADEPIGDQISEIFSHARNLGAREILLDVVRDCEDKPGDFYFGYVKEKIVSLEKQYKR